MTFSVPVSLVFADQRSLCLLQSSEEKKKGLSSYETKDSEWDFVTVFRVLQTEVFHCNYLKPVMDGCCEVALCAQRMKLYVNRDVSTPCAYPTAW